MLTPTTDLTPAELFSIDAEGTCYWCGGDCLPMSVDEVECSQCLSRGIIRWEPEGLVSRWPRRPQA